MNYSSRPTQRNARSLRIAGEVRAEMARKRITAASLSQAADITAATLSRRLSGTISFTLDELDRVAAALDVTVTEIIGRSYSDEAAA